MQKVKTKNKIEQTKKIIDLAKYSKSPSNLRKKKKKDKKKITYKWEKRTHSKKKGVEAKES